MVRSSSTSSFELDFLSKEKGSVKPPPIFQRRRSFRDIQGVVSKMNPEVVKSVIQNSTYTTPNGAQTSYLSPMPRHLPKPSLQGRGGENNIAPMTIFYNGRVLVYDVSPHQAQDILKVAKETFPKSVENSNSEKNLLESLNGDFPILRRNSLQRFLEKRKERQTVVSPYHIPTSAPLTTNNY